MTREAGRRSTVKTWARRGGTKTAQGEAAGSALRARRSGSVEGGRLDPEGVGAEGVFLYRERRRGPRRPGGEAGEGLVKLIGVAQRGCLEKPELFLDRLARAGGQVQRLDGMRAPEVFEVGKEHPEEGLNVPSRARGSEKARV